MSKTKMLIHIVFATERRMPFIPEEFKRDLYNYIFGILKNKGCYTYRINGMTDHVHILIDLNPTIALSDLIRDVKRSSSLWMKENESFPNKANWGKGYYAMSLGSDGLDTCIDYIKNQKIHHLSADFMAEAENLTHLNGMKWYPDDWE